MSEPIVCTAQVACKSSQKNIWELISDTDRLNVGAGYNAVKPTPIDGNQAARYLIHTRMGGFNIAYEEEPYEWEYPHWFSIRRNMVKGPLRELQLRFDIKPTNTGSCVTLTLTLIPRLAFLRPIVAFVGPRELAKLSAEIARVDLDTIQGKRQAMTRTKPLINEKALGPGLEMLTAEGHAEVVKHLATFFREADTVSAMSMRPFALADAWGLDRTAVLRTLMRAAEIGLLELRWQIICPSCRVPSETVPTLREVGEHAACHLCEISFQASLDDAVELVFATSSAARHVGASPFCIGGPAHTPHVLAQAVIRANSDAVLTAPRNPGDYRLFLRGGAECALRVTADGPPTVALNCDAVNRTERVVTGPAAKITVTNTSEKSLHAKIEAESWAMQAASASDVARLTVSAQPIELPTWAAPRT